MTSCRPMSPRWKISLPAPRRPNPTIDFGHAPASRPNTGRQRAASLVHQVNPTNPTPMSPTERAMHLVGTNHQALLAELERHGEEEVRRQLAQKTYSQEKTALAQDWLRHKEQERARTTEARDEAFRQEQARAAERAAAAAERQVVT